MTPSIPRALFGCALIWISGMWAGILMQQHEDKAAIHFYKAVSPKLVKGVEYDCIITVHTNK